MDMRTLADVQAYYDASLPTELLAPTARTATAVAEPPAPKPKPKRTRAAVKDAVPTIPLDELVTDPEPEPEG